MYVILYFSSSGGVRFESTNETIIPPSSVKSLETAFLVPVLDVAFRGKKVKS